MNAPRRAAALARARAVADAVLYEGYLLYPYRASSGKNQSRWQFGVLGPRGAAAAGLGEDWELRAQCPVEASERTTITLTVRFLQLQHRAAEDADRKAVEQLTVGARSWLTWDEAVEREVVIGPLPLTTTTLPVFVPGGTEIEEIPGPDGEPAGRLVRTRSSLHARCELNAEPDGDQMRLTLAVRNLGAVATDKHDAIARSLIGAHILAEIDAGEFISLLEPPGSATAAVGRCAHHRCFPVLAGPPGDHSVLLVSPIILYDHPEIAEQSEGALFDSTEIDEILTLRVMTLTDQEKAQARATDPLAAQLIDRCDAMTPESMQRLHGILRDPNSERWQAVPETRGIGAREAWEAAPPVSPLPASFGVEPRSYAPEPGGLDDGWPPRIVPEVPDGVDWWDPVADNLVRPDSDAVLVAGVRVAKGSRVRLHPSRRADAQDLFFDGRLAEVAMVHQDVDGQAHVGVVVVDDPAADLHEWYGRYLYFAPDELEPIDSPETKGSA